MRPEFFLGESTVSELIPEKRRKKWPQRARYRRADQFSFVFVHPSIYRYWDANPCVKFGLRRAEQSLELDLRQETDYLQKFDSIWRRVNERIDLNSNALALLVRLCLRNEGRLSSSKSFLAKGYPEEMLTTVESIATSVMTGRDEVVDEFDGVPSYQAG